MLRAEVLKTLLHGSFTRSPRACHYEHGASRPPQLPESLHRLANEQSRRPPDFLSGHANQDGKSEHRGNYTQEVNLVREIYCAHGGSETAEVRDVRRTGGGRGLSGGAGKRGDRVFPERIQSFRYQPRSVNDYNTGRGGMAQDGGTRVGTFHGEMDCGRKSQGWTMAC